MPTHPSDDERSHRRASHLRKPTARERAGDLVLPVAFAVAFAVVIAVVILVLIHHRTPTTKNASTAETTTEPTSSSRTPASSSSSSPSSSSPSVPTTTTVPATTTVPTTTVVVPVTVPVGNVLIEVVNGTGAPNLAATTAGSLHAAGFAINGTMDAPSFIYTTSVIEYPPGHLADADTVLAHINGPTRLVLDSSVPRGEVHFIVGSSFTGVAK